MYSHMTQELENEMCEVAKGLNLKHLQLQEGKVRHILGVVSSFPHAVVKLSL